MAYGRNNASATRIFNMDKFAVSTAKNLRNYWLIRVNKRPFQNVKEFCSTTSAKWRKYVAPSRARVAWKEPQSCANVGPKVKEYHCKKRI